MQIKQLSNVANQASSQKVINEMKTMLIGAIAVLVMLVATPTALAQIGAPLSKNPQSAYRSGFEHGVHDAQDPCKPECHVYIWQPGKGFEFHTKEFIHGYIIGFCSIAGPNASMDEDEAAFYCSDGPSSADWSLSK